MATYEELIDRVEADDETVLQDPEVSQVRDSYGRTALHYVAARWWKRRMWLAALYHPDIHKVKNLEGITPLHIAASREVIVLYYHPEAKVMQEDGDYVIHTIARMGYISTHPDYKTLKNIWGKTPKEVWDIRIEERDTNPSDAGIYQDEV